MPLSPVDLLAPAGPVEDTLFPGESTVVGGGATPLEIRLDAYIDQAYAKVAVIAFLDPDEAARLWALHLTFQAAYLRACTRPSSENTLLPVLGAESYSKDQRDALKAQADAYLNAYTAIENAVPLDATGQQIAYQTRQITNTFEW